MATITTVGAGHAVDMSDSRLVSYGGFGSFAPGEASWLTEDPVFAAVYIDGTGLTYSGAGDASELSGGTITSIRINADFADEQTVSTELTIADTAALNPANIDKDDASSFWREVLKGNDSIDLTGLDEDAPGVGLAISTVFGDSLSSRVNASGVTGISERGGKDFIRAGDNRFDLVGDVFFINGDSATSLADYKGGKDRIIGGDVAGGQSDQDIVMSGDAHDINSSGVLRGGADRLTLLHYTGSATMAGDALNQFGGKVIGAADILYIEMDDGGRGSALAGDVRTFAGGKLIGGNDLIRMVGDPGNAAGDVYNARMLAFGTITCGDDTILGSSGDDNLAGDVLQGFDDTVYYPGDDRIDGGAGNDVVRGEGSFPTGRPGDDTLIGGRGHDSLFGQNGDDVLVGDDGRDRLTGGAGADRMTGGADRDSFEWGFKGETGVINATRDRITDFVHGEDSLNLGAIDAIEGGVDDAFAFIGAAAFTQAGQVRATQSGDNTLVELNTRGRSGAESSFLLLDFDASSLKAGDFLL